MLDWLQIPREETPVLVRNDRPCCATRRRRRSPASSGLRARGRRRALRPRRARRRARRASPRRSTAAPRACARSSPRRGRPAARPGRARGSRTTSASRPASPATELTRKATLQARRFDAVLSSFHRAVELARGPRGSCASTSTTASTCSPARSWSPPARAGARSRADNVERFTGAGVYHAAMAVRRRALPRRGRHRRRRRQLGRPGGAPPLARCARSVRVVVRGAGLAATMSRYLVERIERAPEHRGHDRAPRSAPSTATAGSSASTCATATAASSASRSRPSS